MQSPGNHTAVLWVLLLLGLSACGQTPVREQVASASRDRSQTFSQTTAPGDPVRQKVVQTARGMLGAPYRYGGTGPTGFDCSGLVWYSHQRAGINVPRTASQQHRATRRRISQGALSAGDLVFFRIGLGRSYHVGIYVGDGLFIHAPSRGGKVSASSLDNDYWRNRFLGAGNFY